MGREESDKEGEGDGSDWDITVEELVAKEYAAKMERLALMAYATATIAAGPGGKIVQPRPVKSVAGQLRGLAHTAEETVEEKAKKRKWKRMTTKTAKLTPSEVKFVRQQEKQLQNYCRQRELHKSSGSKLKDANLTRTTPLPPPVRHRPW